MDKNYNVDDILSEIKSRKSREKSGAGSERPPARRPEPSFRPELHTSQAREPRPEPSLRNVQEEFFAVQPEEAPGDFQEEFHFDVAPEPDRRPQNPMDFTGHVRPITDKARMRPGKLNQPRQPAPQFDFQPPEEGDDPAPGLDFSAFRPVDADQRPHEHTRVLPTLREQPEAAPAPEVGMRMDADAEVSGPRDSGRLHFGGYYEDDIDNITDDIPETAVDFSEYNSVSDRRDVATDIARVKLWLFVRTSLTLVLTFVLFWFSLSGKYPAMPMPTAFFPEPDTMRMYLLGCTGLTALVALVNSSSVGGGLISLFKMRANSDTLATLALLAAIGQGVAGVVKPDIIDPEAVNLYFPVAGLAMLMGAFGKLTMINRIQSNFRILAGDKKKKALLTVNDEGFCREFIPDALRRPTIAYSAPAEFFTDFLGLSYSDKYDVGINRSVAPVCLLGSIVVGVVSYMLTQSTFSALSAFTAILCVSATFSATFIENIPLGKLTKKLAARGGMVSGNKAVEDFCDTAAVILTESDLFPEGNVRLRGIKTFSQSRIDEAILDAASVICSTNGALTPVFLQMIGGNRGLLKKVDNVVFENGMGVSAWVNSRRVLIGNRLLMQNHGITMPQEALTAAQSRAPEDGELLYLANSGEVAAQFAVSYHIDNDLAAQLDQFAARDKGIIVYTTDANITPHRIWELYGYPEELIEVMPAERHTQFRQMTEPRENAIAEIVYTGRAATLIAAILACINARSSILSATVLQLVQIVLGYGLIAFLAFMGAIASLSIVQLLIYQTFWFLIIFVLQKAKTP